MAKKAKSNKSTKEAHQNEEPIQAVPHKQSSIKKTNKNDKEQVSLNENPNDFLKLNHIHDNISENMQKFIQLKVELVLLGLSEESTLAQKEMSNVIEVAERAGLKAIEDIVIEAQKEVYEKQRNVFKIVNKLESSYENIKNVLVETNALNNTEIEEALSVIELKIKDKKQEIETLNQTAEKANDILKKPLEDSLIDLN